MKKFNEWFDPYNSSHMEIISLFYKDGYWPDDPIILSLDQSDRIHWSLIAMSKMAEAWVKSFI